MRKDKEKAVHLRRAGKSYRQIHAELKVPIATLSDWFGKIDWSRNVAKKLAAEVQKQHTSRLLELNRTRGLNLARAYREAAREAVEELQIYKYNPVFIAGLMLYWGEGGKNPHDGVKFSNSDPEMIRFYIFFLTKACKIPLDKIKLHLILYPDHEEKICRSFWSKKSGVPVANFTKSVVIRGRGKVRRLSWGVCIVTISSLYFKRKMLEWIRLLPVELMSEEYYARM